MKYGVKRVIDEYMAYPLGTHASDESAIALFKKEQDAKDFASKKNAETPRWAWNSEGIYIDEGSAQRVTGIALRWADGSITHEMMEALVSFLNEDYPPEVE